MPPSASKRGGKGKEAQRKSPSPSPDTLAPSEPASDTGSISSDKSHISMGELSPKQASGFRQDFQEFLFKLTERMTNISEELHEAVTVAEIDELIETVEELEKAMERIEKIRSILKTDKAVVISFSRFTDQTMESHLGVDPAHPVRGPLSPTATRKLIISLNETHDHGVPLYQSVNWRHSYLGDALEQLEKFVLVHKEQGTRMAINYWLTEIIHALDHQRPKSKFTLKLINEFTLSTSTKQSILSENDLLSIDFRGNKTVLSGSTDYTLLVKNVPRNLRKDVIQLKAKIITFKNVQDEVKECIVLLIEAKHQRVTLLDHIPQVIAQCIAVALIDPQRKHVSFLLTKGTEWVFGVLCSNEPGSAYPYKYFLTQVFKVDSAMVKAAKSNGDLRDSYHLLVNTMLIWATKPAEEIQVAFDEAHSGEMPAEA